MESKSYQRGSAIEYFEMKEYDLCWTGTALYSNPTGDGQFHVKVSGGRDDVRAYADTARIVSLSLVSLARIKPSEIMQARAEFRDRECQARLKLFLQLANENQFDLKTGPDRIWQILQEREQTQRNKTLDLTADRYIEIEPLDWPSGGETCLLSYLIDPETVAPGRRDVYSVPGYISQLIGGDAFSYTIPYAGGARGVVEASGGTTAIYEYTGATLIVNNQFVGW